MTHGDRRTNAFWLVFSISLLPLKLYLMKLFTEDIWQEYVSKIENNFKLKTYPHLDTIFHFPKRKEEVKILLSDPDTFNKHSFVPFLKTLQKTPRYRYQQTEGHYDLETKIRPIAFASHFDSYIYSFYAHALNHHYQKRIRKEGYDSVVLAYRNDLEGQCNIQFAKEAFDAVRQMINTNGECSVIALDIKGYFDNIDHQTLKKQWLELICEDTLPKDQYKVFKSLTTYSYINYNSFLKHFNINLKKYKKEHGTGVHSILSLIPCINSKHTFKNKMKLLRERNLITFNSEFDEEKRKRIRKTRGIPQGSPMSAILSNIYLMDFDKEIHTKSIKENFTYRRYCDDILIICNPLKVNYLKDYVMSLINEKYKLTIQDRKTDVVDFKDFQVGKIRSFKRKYAEDQEKFLPLPATSENFKNLQYLGFEFNGQNIYIRSSSLSRYFRKMKARIVKTVSMSYSKNNKSDTIFKQQLYSRYSHIGKRNFITYAKNAASTYYTNSKKEIKEGMNSLSIRKQIARHMKILREDLKKTSQQRAKRKRTGFVKK